MGLVFVLAALRRFLAVSTRLAFGLGAVGSLTAARAAIVRHVEPRTLEDNACWLDQPVHSAFTFRAYRDRRIIEALATLKLNATVITLVCIHWHRTLQT